MSVSPPSTGPEAPAAPGGRPYRLSVEQYHRMAEAGILGEDDPVELLGGVLVAKMTKNPPHIIATDLLQAALTRIVPAGWYVSMQNPITLPATASEPEPDGQVVRGEPRDYKHRRVGPQDVALVVEVSDTSYADDLAKRVTYAGAAIPIYWIVNLVQYLLEVYSDPTGPAEPASYRTTQTYGPDDEVPLVIADREVARIAVRDLLP